MLASGCSFSQFYSWPPPAFLSKETQRVKLGNKADKIKKGAGIPTPTGINRNIEYIKTGF
jgi:hypothetical protein